VFIKNIKEADTYMGYIDEKMEMRNKINLTKGGGFPSV
jgi:hypothetical protein